MEENIDDLIAEAMQDDEFAADFKAAGDKYDFAVQFKMHRMLAGKSIEDVATSTGMTEQYIEEIEAAQVNITIEEISKLVHALKKEVTILIL